MSIVDEMSVLVSVVNWCRLAWIRRTNQWQSFIRHQGVTRIQRDNIAMRDTIIIVLLNVWLSFQFKIIQNMYWINAIIGAFARFLVGVLHHYALMPAFALD